METNYVASESILIRIDHEELENKIFKGVIYLDRDGVIIEDYGYVGDQKNVKLITGAEKFIRCARSNRYLIAIVTNQSGVGRGYYTWTNYIEVTDKMNSLLGKEARPHIIIASGVRPRSGCEGEKFRKPNTGMIKYIRSVIQKQESDFEMLIGDKLSDIQCGLNANIKVNAHVLTGHGSDERNSVVQEQSRGNDREILLANDLSDLMQYVS